MAYKPPAGRKFYCCPASGEVEGPFELVELAGLLRANHITGETPVVPEGEEQWLAFEDRPEYNLAKEIPPSAIALHVKETAEAQTSSFSPRKLLTLVWVLLPVFLYVLYRIVMAYLNYEVHHGVIISAEGS